MGRIDINLALVSYKLGILRLLSRFKRDKPIELKKKKNERKHASRPLSELGTHTKEFFQIQELILLHSKRHSAPAAYRRLVTNL